MLTLSKMKIENILSKIRDGDISSAKSDIFYALENNFLTIKDKLNLSQLLNDYGKLSLAVDILGTPRPYYEYELLDSQEIMAQFYLGVLYNNLGSRYYSDYIIDLCKKEISKRKLNPLNYIARYYNHLVGKYYKNDEKEKFLVTMNEGLKNKEVGPYQRANLQIDLVNFHLRDSNLDEARKIIDQLDFDYISRHNPILRRHREIQAQLTFKSGHLQKAKKMYEELLLEELHTYQKSNAHFHLGLLFSQNKAFTLAKKHLRASWEIFQDENTPRIWLRGFSYYFLYIKKNNLNYNEKLSFFCNRLFSTHKEKVIIKDANCDCIQIYKRKVNFRSYKDIVKEGKEKKALLDLRTGLFIKNNEIKHLGDTKALALQLLCSSAILGIHRIYLQDYVYRKDFESIGNGNNKLDKLIFDLRQDGFDIERQQNRYFWLPPENILVCLSDQSSIEPPVFQMAKRYEYFNRKQLQENYSISKATAIRWINHGLELNCLKIYNNNRKSVLYSAT